MNISELTPKQGNVDVTGEITEKEQAREFNKFGKAGRVANATIKDSSGSMKLTLWNEQIDQVSQGDTVHIKNGYVNEWRGDLQLTTGRIGTIEIISSAKKEPGSAEPAAAQEKKPAAEQGKPSAKRKAEEEDDDSSDEDEELDIEEEEVSED